MNAIDRICFICKSNILIVSSDHYLKCIKCGHEIIKNVESQTFIVNDLLSEKNILSLKLFDKFKQTVLKKCTATNDFLLDIGSASGKFLYYSKQHFKRCMGIEVTEECIEFSKNCLGLVIEKDLDNVNDKISVATFWHSLEHMPSKTIENLLNGISLKSSPDIRIIVSVPNKDSLQFAFFKEAYAFYDPQNHIHQFSVRSLDILLDKYDFEREYNFYSFSYSIFGYLQGFVNKFHKIHNYYYYRQKRGWNFDKNKVELLLRDTYNFLLLILFSIPSLVFSIYDFFNKEKGAIITACYKRRKN